MQNQGQNLGDKMALMLGRYLAVNPSEAEDLQRLSEQLSEEPQEVFQRSNMRGHITASALVLDRTLTNMLLINHPLHNRWLHPGGHVEAGCNSLWDAALEEVTQETGLAAMTPIEKLARLGIPLDIDTHPIPANPKKSEGAHFHHDVMFMAVSLFDFEPQPQAGDAVKEAKWLPLSALRGLPGDRMKRMAAKVAVVLGQSEEKTRHSS